MYRTRGSRKTDPAAHATRRASAQEKRRSVVNGRKGLTSDGSTRAWRRIREQVPGKPRSCPDGRRPFVNHKQSRLKGGKDQVSNLEWRCGYNPGVGRPKGS